MPGLLQGEQVQVYFATPSPQEAASFLAGTLGLVDYEHDARSAVKMDYFAYALQCAKDCGFGPLRTASLLDVASNVLQATEGGADFATVEATFKVAMLKLTSSKPGSDSHLFSPDQVAHVAKFFARTFFRHFRLYSHMFSSEQELTECTASLLVETAIVPSFVEALSEEEWNAELAAVAAAQEAAAREAAEAEAAAAATAAAEAAAREAEEAERRRQEQLARKPATLEEAVEHLVAVRLEAEKKVMAAEYADKEEVLLRKIAELEARAPSPVPPAPAAGAKK